MAENIARGVGIIYYIYIQTVYMWKCVVSKNNNNGIGVLLNRFDEIYGKCSVSFSKINAC